MDEMLMILPAPDFACFDKLDHSAGHQLGEKEGTFEVRRQDLVPSRFGQLQQVGPARRGNAGVVDQQIDSATVSHGLFDQPAPVRVLADIGLDGIRLSSGAADLVDDGLRSIQARPIVDDHQMSLAGQFEGDSAADATRGSGHERDRMIVHGHWQFDGVTTENSSNQSPSYARGAELGCQTVNRRRTRALPAPKPDTSKGVTS